MEVQVGKYSFVAYDLFVKHMAFYVGDVIDVGIEILAMKELQGEMSSGVGYYEGELYNLIREGRGARRGYAGAAANSRISTSTPARNASRAASSSLRVTSAST